MKSEAERLTTASARVSGVAQKPGLVNQVKAREQFCTEQAREVDELMQASGSGLNDKRKQCIHVFERIEQGRVKTLILAHRDRMSAFRIGMV